MSYQIQDGKIQTQSCELNVVHHCNFSCRACSHLSPRIKKHFVDPEQVLRDFTILSKYYRPEHVRLLGGEPLLHPDLLKVIDAVRNSGISECIRIITNGILLWRMPEQFWKNINEIHVSIYPSYKVSPKKLESYQKKAHDYSVAFKILYFDYFRESYAELGTKDTNIVKRIYSTCQIAHIWHCHNVSDGHFYKCPQSLFIPKGLDINPTSMNNDGLKITDSETFLNDLLDYLQSGQPLESCSNCLGSVGKRFPHEINPRGMDSPHSTEELLDWNYLRLLEQNPHANNLCVRSEGM